MKLKIYFGDEPVYLCDALDDDLTELSHHPDVVYIDELSTPAINSLLHEIKKEDFHAAIIIHEDFEKLKKVFFRHFTFIHAAGGIVQNDNKEILFIFRRGKWDLPKGKLDKGEKPEVCAKREIMEETGVSKLKLHYKIGETFHAYDEFGKHYLKQSDWFYFTCPAGEKLTPQTDEDITEAKWIATKEVRKPMNNTYSTIKDIMREFFDKP